MTTVDLCLLYKYSAAVIVEDGDVIISNFNVNVVILFDVFLQNRIVLAVCHHPEGTIFLSIHQVIVTDHRRLSKGQELHDRCSYPVRQLLFFQIKKGMMFL